MKHLLTVVLLVCCSLTYSIANAMPFTDRASFEALLGNSVTDDYETGYAPLPQTDATMSAVLGETRYMSTGSANNNSVFNLTTSNKGYCSGCNGSFLLDFTSTSVGNSNGVFGVGVDYFDPSDINHAFVTYGDGSTEDTDLLGTIFTSKFFGVTSDSLISTIHFGLANGVATATQVRSFAIDNLTIGDSGDMQGGGGPVASVSEPSILALLSFGFIGILFTRRKKT